MAKQVIEVQGLTKRFDDLVAVDEISFELAEGEILGLLGPNGAGKTTLIQMLLNLVIPSSGSIRILGLALPEAREAILAQVNFSSTYVALPPTLTVRENLIVFSRLYGLRPDRVKINALLAKFEIAELADRLTRSLSTGQLTRLSLAKSLLNDPKILFLDEPTASLDPDMADKTRSLLRAIRDQGGLSILCTSHNMKEMEELPDRIIMLDKGEIVASGSPKEVIAAFDKENLEEVFLRIARGETEPSETMRQ